MYARIDALTCPRFWSLLPSSVFDWVVIIVSVRYASTPLNTLTHPVSITSTTLCTICTGLSSFWLVPVSTVLAVQVYIFGSVSPPGRHIILPRGTHHIYLYYTDILFYIRGALQYSLVQCHSVFIPLLGGAS